MKEWFIFSASSAESFTISIPYFNWIIYLLSLLVQLNYLPLSPLLQLNNIPPPPPPPPPPASYFSWIITFSSPYISWVINILSPLLEFNHLPSQPLLQLIHLPSQPFTSVESFTFSVPYFSWIIYLLSLLHQYNQSPSQPFTLVEQQCFTCLLFTQRKFLALVVL